MSEIKLNLIDSETIRRGNVHGSIGDACVAALSAEPETIPELEVALGRFIKQVDEHHDLGFLSDYPDVDEVPYDAGILIIDLAARIIACDSTYSMPSLEGQINYHDGHHSTEVPAFYRLPDDWLLLSSVEEYKGARRLRREERAAIQPLDARVILYGYPLIEFISREILSIPNHTMSAYESFLKALPAQEDEKQTDASEPRLGIFEPENPMRSVVKEIHARWLLTPRKDLRGQSPRDVMLAKQELIDTDLHNRMFQWSMLLEGPPCLPRDSFAYRYAGFGSHEWIIYYELVRDLLWNGVTNACFVSENNVGAGPQDIQATIDYLEEIKNDWLERPMDDSEGRIPAQVIENERKRLPEAMGGRSMVVDEDCPCCKWMGDEAEAGLAIYFWHLDGCHMEEDFAFSSCATHDKWEAEQIRQAEFRDEMDRKWKEREERVARGETLEPDPLFDPIPLDDLSYLGVQLEPEIPES